MGQCWSVVYKGNAFRFTELMRWLKSDLNALELLLLLIYKERRGYIIRRTINQSVRRLLPRNEGDLVRKSSFYSSLRWSYQLDYYTNS